MPVGLRCFVRKNLMGNLPNVKAQLEGHTHFFKSKNLKEKLSMELCYLKKKKKKFIKRQEVIL